MRRSRRSRQRRRAQPRGARDLTQDRRDVLVLLIAIVVVDGLDTGVCEDGLPVGSARGVGKQREVVRWILALERAHAAADSVEIRVLEPVSNEQNSVRSKE